MLRALYRTVVPASIRDAFWRYRLQLKQSMARSRRSCLARTKDAYRRVRYSRGILRTRRPASYPQDSWAIDRRGAHAMRRVWVSDAVSGTVLDVGCNRGYASCVMAKTAEHVTALDIDQDSLRQGSELASACGIANISFTNGNAYSLPYAENAFDTVTLLEILEHLERPADAVKEALRVASARVIITVPAQGYMTTTPGHIQDFSVADIVGMLPSASYAQSHPPFTFVLYEAEVSN